uniref:Uncharacterized protein n=1 Tax=Zea mays TaxID=4577 RepID=A0A804NWJ7_MAIZE
MPPRHATRTFPANTVSFASGLQQPQRSSSSGGAPAESEAAAPPDDDLDLPPDAARGFLRRCFGAAAAASPWPSAPSAASAAFATRRSRRNPSAAQSRRFAGSLPPDPLFPLALRGRSALPPPSSPPPACSSPHPSDPPGCEGSGSLPLAVPGEALNSSICST